VVFARKNFAKYADIVERAAALAKRGVRFEICRNAATFLGFTAQDFHGFAALVPPAPFALAYWQSKGYTLNAVGATMPITPLSEHNKLDTNR
jgi:intracellular sulfur oxidation DsrE/DsrF family protein